MKNKWICVLPLLLIFSCTSTSIKAQEFRYTYNGVTVTYSVTSVRNHEVKVYYVPKDVTAVTIPAEVRFNGESFKVTEIGSGYRSSGGLFYSESDKNHSFSNCKLLKSVILPNTVKRIEYCAFMGCSWLRNINMPSRVEIINADAFKYCESLISITLPASIRFIGGGAFKGCNDCSFHLSEKLGFIMGDTLVSAMENGEKKFSNGAFGEKYEVVSIDELVPKIIASPNYYLQVSYKKTWATIVKKVLIKAGKFEEILALYPGDTEAQKLQREMEIRRIIKMGDDKRNEGNYEEAKRYYEEALRLSPDNELILIKIKNTDEAIAAQNARKAEQERLRKIAEEKVRREAEEEQVRNDVESYIRVAKNEIEQGNLWDAIETLEKAIDETKTHNYDYRTVEMTQRIDSIQEIQELVSDENKVFDYKDFRPDLYMRVKNDLDIEIKSYLKEKDRDVEPNHITLSLYTNNQPGAFQLKESSRTLKKFCEYALENVQLKPLVIDGQSLNSCATFNYDVEYVSGTVKVSSDGGHLQVNPRFDMSPRLEYNLGQVFSEKMSGMSSFYDGTYKFDVKSMDINGQMEHSVVFESVHAANGPQNAWKSLLVPGLGDLYVDGFFGKDEMRKIWWIVPVTCYTAVGMGIWGILNPQEKQTYNMQTNTYETKDNKSTWIGMIAVGGAIWVADVVQVWIKGAKNKRECEERIGKINFAYDAIFDAPELVYSLSF